MVRRHRSGRSLRDLRAEVEAAEKRGLDVSSDQDRHRDRKPRPDLGERRPKPVNGPRMRVVWAVCDLSGRTIATFPYAEKAAADAHAAELKVRGKGKFFVRSVKEPMD